MKDQKFKLKLNHRFFGGCAYVRHGEKFNIKHALIKPVRNGFFALRDFEEPEEISVTDIYRFCGLVRFVYKKYVCVVSEKDIKYLK